MAYSKVGNWQQADPDLREAIRLGSRNLSAYHNLGYTLFMQHRYPEAIQYFDQALALQPDLALALRYRGLAKQAIGQAAEGLADLQRAHALDPKL
jgi:superkiller protein 3